MSEFFIIMHQEYRSTLAVAFTSWNKEKSSSTTASISGLVVEYIVAIDVTRVRFPADAFLHVFAHARARAMHLYGTSPSGAQETVVHKRTSHS